MYKEPIDSFESLTIRTEEGNSSSTAERTTPTFLALPKFGPEVVTCYSAPADPALIHLAEFAIKMGLIQESDIENNPSVTKVVKNVFDRHFNTLLGKVNFLNFDFEFSTHSITCEYIDNRVDNPSIDEDDEDNYKIPEQYFMEFAVRNEDADTVYIGKALDALEIVHPGLGQTAYAVLCKSGSRSLQMASTYHMFNESQVFNLCDDYEEHRQIALDEGEEFVTKEEWLQNIPHWMANPIASLTPYQVQQIGFNENCPAWVKEVTEAIMDVFHSYNVESNLGRLDLYDIRGARSALIIRHNENDQMLRAVHDMDAYANGNPDYHTNTMHLEALDLSDFEACKSWLKRIEDACVMLKGINRLLYSLTYEPQL